MRRLKHVFKFFTCSGTRIKRKKHLCDGSLSGTCGNRIFRGERRLKNPLKKLNMAAANKVVHRALIDSRKKKSVSVYGAGIKAAEIMTKLLPVSLILKAEELFVS